MVRYKYLLVLVIFVKFTAADIFQDMMRSKEPCKELCAGHHFSLPSNKHTRQVCQRGCRLFNISKRRGTSLDSAKQKCYHACGDAYGKSEQFLTCTTGCDLATKKLLQPDLLTDIWMIYIGQDGTEVKSHTGNSPVIVPQISDMDLENEVLLTDPVFRNQLDWSYGMEYKIPETHIKTMPIGNSNDDDNIPGIKSDSNHSHLGINHDWLDCIAKNSGLPRWVLASVIIIGVVFALWVCMAPEKYTAMEVSQPFLVNDVEFTPPPKYELVNDKV